MQNQITYTQALDWLDQIHELLVSTNSLKPSYVAPFNAIRSTIASNAKVETMPSVLAIKAKQ
jgi:hypothetical protein